MNNISFLIIFLFLLGSSPFVSSQDEITAGQLEALKKISNSQTGIGEEYEEVYTYEGPKTLTDLEDQEKINECASEECVFGYTLFNASPSTFVMSSNVPVPPSYTLGPGDQLIIEYFGNNNLKKEGFVTRSGVLNLPLLGPVTLAGLSFTEAENIIQKKVETGLVGTQSFVTFGKLRSINIYILGNAYKPGVYTVSGLSSLTNALFASGGVNRVGTLRNIELKRKDKTVQTFDLYDLILKGDTSNDIRLQQGDTIFIPLRRNIASIKGSTLRIGNYEFKEGEALIDLINFGGELNQNSRIELSRINQRTGKREIQIIDPSDEQFLANTLVKGDRLNIVEIDSLKSRNVRLGGEFLYPGYYGINEGDTLSDVINRAGGLKESAYTNGAIFKRKSIAEMQRKSYLVTADELEKSLIDTATSGIPITGEAYAGLNEFINKLRESKPEGRQVIDLDLLKLRTDPKLNLVLEDGDELIVPRRSTSVSVVGEVLNSASHLHRESLTAADYISFSGGMTRGADKSKIFIIRPNGQSYLLNDRLFGKESSSVILPGSTIVISRDPDPFDGFKLASVLTPILADLAISAASIAAINN